jgi:hypothetical protein
MDTSKFLHSSFYLEHDLASRSQGSGGRSILQRLCCNLGLRDINLVIASCTQSLRGLCLCLHRWYQLLRPRYLQLDRLRLRLRRRLRSQPGSPAPSPCQELLNYTENNRYSDRRKERSVDCELVLVGLRYQFEPSEVLGQAYEVQQTHH